MFPHLVDCRELTGLDLRFIVFLLPPLIFTHRSFFELLIFFPDLDNSIALIFL